MSSNDRPTEKELAQAFFSGLIPDGQAQPDPALNPETARLIRELVLSEQAANRVTRQDFAAVSQRIRRKVQLPASSEPVGTPPPRWNGPLPYENEPALTRRGGGVAWNKFLALTGMAATIVLVVGLLVLSLAAVRQPETRPAAGATPAVIPTVQAPPTPTPKPPEDLFNPKVFLPQALVDVAKRLSLDPNALQKQLQSGTTLADIAKKQGVDLASLKALMLNSFKAQIDEKKSGGLLTQTQADDLFKTSSAFIDDFLVTPASDTTVKLIPTPEKKG